MKQYKTDFPDTLKDLMDSIYRQAGGFTNHYLYSRVAPETVAQLTRIKALAAAALAYIDEEEGGPQDGK